MPAELTGALDRADVRRFLDDADERGIAPRIAADRAQLFFGEIEAPRARPHSLRRASASAVGEALALLGRLLQQVVRQPQRRLPPDAGEPRQLAGQIVDRRHVRRPG